MREDNNFSYKTVLKCLMVGYYIDIFKRRKQRKFNTFKSGAITQKLKILQSANKKFRKLISHIIININIDVIDKYFISEKKL